MYRYYNKNSHNNRIDDCVIRSLATLTNRSWREVYDELSNLAGNEGLMFESADFVEDYLDKRYERIPHYSKTVGEFTKEYPHGRYAITMQGHITAVIDGDIIDTFDCSDRIIRCAWAIY